MSIYFVYALSLLNGTSLFATRVVLSLYALSLGAEPFTIGLLAATFSIFPMLLAVTAGKLIDRFGPRWPMTLGAIGSGLGMLVPYFFPALPAVFIASAMSGLSMVFFNLATQNLVGVLSSPDNRAQNFSNYSLTVAASNFLGPLIGGFSADHAGYVTACLHLALLTVAPVAILAFCGGRLPGGTVSSGQKEGGGVRKMLADPVVRRTLITGSLINAGINMYQFYLPVYAHSIGLSASTIGMILAVNSAAAFVVRFVLPGLLAKYKEEQLLTYAFLLGAAGLALLPVIEFPLLLALVSFIFGLGMGCGQPIVTILMFSSSKDGRSGEALGLKVTTNHLTKLVGPVVFGAIASAFGLSPMFWINAAMMAAGGMISRPKKGA
jgi:MFS family permease